MGSQPAGRWFCLAAASPRGLASHKGRGSLDMVLWEASLLGDGCAWGPVAERARLPQGKGGLGVVLAG